MTTERQRLNVVLCWHMHQPEYRDLLTNQYQLPWTYLHAIRDYIDMAELLEASPDAKAVVNFGPILLEQLEDYATQVERFLADGTRIGDPILAALDLAVLPADQRQRTALIEACLRANEERIINRFPAYRRLVDIARWLLDNYGSADYLNDQFIADLITWYHLGWLGETVRRDDERVQNLQEKGSSFTLHERREVMQLIGELLGGVIQRYSRLVENGQLELSCSAWAHPILPLLIDFEAARESLPDARLPVLDQYPGGKARARLQIEQGQATFEKHFGFTPAGSWPPEGGISTALVPLLAASGVKWTASGENVLFNSLKQAGQKVDRHKKTWLHKMYEDDGTGLKLFFRDDELSDLIGFTYSDWHADDAVADLVSRLEKLAASYDHPGARVVSIIMDGENAWEHYPENAYHFLSALYAKLVENAHLHLTTFSEFIEAQPEGEALDELVAGSWVYGTFSTWMGDPEKNRAWDILCDAKRVYDDVMANNDISADRRDAIDRQLAICEASDWFWWLGDYNPREAVSDFERLFRLHIANLYQLMHREPPQHLSQTLSDGRGMPAVGGVMRPGTEPVD